MNIIAKQLFAKRNIIITLLLAAIFTPLGLLAQKIENVSFKADGNKIIVSYDLVDCPKNYFYDISLKFMYEEGGFIKPLHPTGDLTKVLPGKNKTIVWDVLGDNQEIKGRVSPIVAIDGKQALDKIIGGPANAFLSMLLPGLGDMFVYPTQFSNQHSKKHNYGYYLAAGYLLSGCLAYFEYNSYQNDYTNYHAATLQRDMDSYYTSANNSYMAFQACLGVAATIWVVDVIHVAVKGYKNKHRQENGLTFKEPKTNLYFSGTNKNFQIGLAYKF